MTTGLRTDPGARLRSVFGPSSRVVAPGRVNLIGGQIDYHEGPVVSMAIDRAVHVAFRRRADSLVTVRSVDLDGEVVVDAGDGGLDPAAIMPPWGRLVGGVVRELAGRGRPPVGADLGIASDLVIGGGLSSSAAFEVGVARALCEVAGWSLPAVEQVLACQAAEHRATGVPCGIQDQFSSVAGVAGHALLIDCRTYEVAALPIPAGVQVLVVDSGVARTLEGSPWAQRRAESFTAAHRLGLRVLRDATPDQVADDPRGRHAVHEMRRVWEFADALRTGDFAAAGALMVASHVSSRDDMEVSIPELDALVDCLLEAGAHGARLTGGGFGGCCVALVDADRARLVARDACNAYGRRTGRTPTPLLTRASEGAHVVVV